MAIRNQWDFLVKTVRENYSYAIEKASPRHTFSSAASIIRQFAFTENKIEKKKKIEATTQIIEEILDENPTPLPVEKAINTEQAILRGVMSGGVTSIVTNPFDKFLANYTVRNLPVNNLSNSAVTLFKTQPFKGLRFYLSSSVLRNSLIFGAVPDIQNRLEHSGVNSMQSENLAFVGSAVLENTCWTPFAVVRQHIYATKANTALEVFKAMPLKTLTYSIAKSWSWGNMKNILFWPSYITLIRYGEERFLSDQDKPYFKLTKQFAIGSAAGLAAATLSYPADVIQKNLTMFPHNTTYKLIKKATQDYGRQTGTQFFYRGYSVAAIRMLLMTGLTNVSLQLADDAYTHLRPEAGKRMKP